MLIYATAQFWLGLLERAIKTGAQAALAFLATAGAGVLDWDWVALGSITAASVVLSVLTSLADPTRTTTAGTVTTIAPAGPADLPAAPAGRHAAR